MMNKLSVGYPLFSRISFYDSIAPYLDSIGEVYFGWENFRSGRATFKNDPRYDSERLTEELIKFKKRGIKLNLLLNGNCFGEEAVSLSLAEKVKGILSNVDLLHSLDSVTCASPFIAHTVKKHFPKVDVRASVNMWIDGIFGMEQCKDTFDSFYVKRDYNFCIDEIQKEREWCDKNGKRLYILANSGCIPNCAYHTFHDNMISHSEGLESQTKDPDFEPFACRKLLCEKENRHLILSGNLIRPEDIHRYDELVCGIKLATRIHPYPAMIIGAYAKEKWSGDVSDLTEPGFGDILNSCKPDNSKIPDRYWKTKTECLRARHRGDSAYCRECGYCEELYREII